jgi:biopolymer transport protein ExbD
MKYVPESKTLKAEINMVPFLDVLLVLVVILMASVSSVFHTVSVQLPKAQTRDHLKLTLKDYPLLITLKPDGRFDMKYTYFDDKNLEPSKFLVRLRAFAQKHQQTRILLQADQSSSYQQVISAMALMNQAGFSQIGLVTEK